MIKRPYNNQGEIQYLEIIKIFLLISFFIALYSRITEGIVLEHSPIIMLMLTTFVVTSFLIGTVQDVNELLGLIKSFVIHQILTPIILPTKINQNTQTSLLDVFVTKPNIHTLQVIRC